MELSYWEYKNWLAQVDYTVVGSGIVGLSCAIRLKQRFPKAKVLVLNRAPYLKGQVQKMLVSLVLEASLRYFLI